MVTRSKGSVVVDPSSFQRSAGLTGGGTVSWQLAPAPLDGADESLALLSAARGLGGALRGPRPAAPRAYGTSAALVLSDGVITTGTSLREPPERHPLASALLSETMASLLRRGQRAGLGPCVESTLLSNRLHQIEQRWSAEGRPGDDFRSHVFQAFRGAMLTVRQIGDVNGRPHGALRQPCRVCRQLLPALGIAVTEAAGWDPALRPGGAVGRGVPTPGDMPSTDTAQREWMLGAPFRAEGTGAAGLAQVAQRLLEAGPGATALVMVAWPAPNPGPFLLTAANRDGGVFWLDSVSREVSGDPPPYLAAVDGVWSILLDAGGRPAARTAVPPPPAPAATLFDPANPTMHDGARFGELKLMIVAYPDAGTEARVALRAEIAALIDDLGVRPGTSDSNGRWTTLPPDLAAALLALATPMPTPSAVATVLAADPARLNAPQKAWQRDFEDRLADALTETPPGRTSDGAVVAGDLADRLHRLAVAGEASPASVPRLPAYAGQVIGLPPDRLSVLRELDATVADTAAATGVYIDLTGRPDLTPYARQGAGPIRLTDPTPNGSGPTGFDLATEAGRAALLDSDRRQARAGFRAAHSGDPAALTLLSTHDFHYVGVHRPGVPREMALVPDLVAAAVRAISPVLPPPAEPPQRPPRPPAPEPRAEPTQPTQPTETPEPPETAEPATASGVAVMPPAAEAPTRPGPTVDESGAPVTGRASVAVPVQRPPAATGPSFAYYALADHAHEPTGLLVVAMLPDGPRTRRWEAPGARSAGSPNPVSRQRAEEISRLLFGAELPAETRLPEVFRG
jgi:hypothetical protein